jgi:hypothetical protein
METSFSPEISRMLPGGMRNLGLYSVLWTVQIKNGLQRDDGSCATSRSVPVDII